jgi:cellulose synthase/poly-beta-1,6-N-acetylglucosamine synthase-like glycosyltransferase
MNAWVSGLGALADCALVTIWLRALVHFGVSCAGMVADRVGQGEADIDLSPVSIVIPAWNEEKTIARALRALEDQVGRIAHVIVVDDGSTDRTAMIAEETAPSYPLELLRLPANGGKAAALNAGVARIRTEHVVTLDADTLLAPGAIAAALRMAAAQRADAVSFWIEAEAGRDASLLSHMQGWEYRLGMNFDRAGQARVGIISVMPGAATLFRRAALDPAPFYDRTCTEDADLTLGLARTGHRLMLCRDARAITIPPAGLRGLIRQRRRWIAGHIQCCRLHAPPGKGTSVFRWLTYPNFLLGTFFPLISILLAVLLLIVDRTPFFSITFISAFFISMTLLYTQRIAAILLQPYNKTEHWVSLLLEPVLLTFVNIVAFGAATGLIVRGSFAAAGHRGERQW